jgi:beta-phosphoglucomutase
MPTPQAFIFDLDGVLTDTAEYHFRAWQRLADEENIVFTREDNEALRGVSRRQSLLFLLKGRALSEDQMEAWMARKNDYYRAYLNDIKPADLLPGVVDFLNEAKSHGIKLGVGSASKNAREAIQGLGITDVFDAIGDGYSVSNPKPAPDLFVWVAGRLGVPAQNAVVFEDAEAGIEAALAAGMYAVGLGPQSRVGKADVVLPSLESVKLDQIIQALEAASSSLST